MNTRNTSAQPGSHITIRVSGDLFRGHLEVVERLIESALDCQLWPVLNLAQLEELDSSALAYLMEGEDRKFGIISCPTFIREWMDQERARAA